MKKALYITGIIVLFFVLVYAGNVMQQNKNKEPLITESVEQILKGQIEIVRECEEQRDIFAPENEEMAEDKADDSEEIKQTAGRNEIEYGEIVQKIIEINQDEITAFYERYPEIFHRWVGFSGFDFTGDGKMEIICSYLYVETATSISYNYVYDAKGEKLFEFVSNDFRELTIYEGEDATFYIRNQMHIAADHDVLMYEEITEDDEWNVKIPWVEWDTRDGAKILADSPDGYSVYTDFTKEEREDFMQKNYYEGMLKVFWEKEPNGNAEQLRQYEQIYENLGEGKKVQLLASMLTWEKGIEWVETAQEVTEETELPAEDSDVVTDFLAMNPEEFQEKYPADELWEDAILYCAMDSWQYQTTLVDEFQESDKYFDVTDISAIRFINADLREISAGDGADGEDNGISEGEVFIQYFGDYAVSLYFRETEDVQSGEKERQLMEFSYVKAKLREGEAPERLYQNIEKWYYEAREEIQSGNWLSSPDGTKAACVSNGMLPKHPAQIFVRYEDGTPDFVLRQGWECELAGWIDEEHLIFFYQMGKPLLLHLETGQVEEITTEDNDFDAYGASYEIQEDRLVCLSWFEEEGELCSWDIIKEDGDIRIVELGRTDE